jgi:hypothetical protein
MIGTTWKSFKDVLDMGKQQTGGNDGSDLTLASGIGSVPDYHDRLAW